LDNNLWPEEQDSLLYEMLKFKGLCALVLLLNDISFLI
jgi:hypothetical protein